MKALLVMTAILEAATGVALMVAPSRVASLLLGASLDAVAAQILARIAGAALISLGVACWFARPLRHDPASRAAQGLIMAMLLYNAVVAALLVYGATRDGLRGVGLWPAAVLHSALAAWCIACLVPLFNSSHSPATSASTLRDSRP